MLAKRLITWLLLALVAGCQRPIIPPPSGERLVGAASAESRARGASREAWSVLRGRVDTSAFRIQSSVGEIADAATVSLIRTDTGDTVSSAVTEEGGVFSLNFHPSFVPDSAKTYFLEAIKGLKAGGQPNRVGADAARVRTIVKFIAGSWQTLTSDGVTIDRTTTALAVILGLRSIDAALYIGSLTYSTKAASGADQFTPPAGSQVTQTEIDTVFALVAEAIRGNRDPIFALTYNAVSTVYSAVPSSVMLQSVAPTTGRFGDVVSIKGANFDPEPSRNIVRFGGVQASAVGVNASGTELQVEVPVGAMAGALTVQIGEKIFGGLQFRTLNWDGHNPFDAQDNLYVTSYETNSLWRVDPQGNPTLVLQDAAKFNGPWGGVAVDGAGNVYVSSRNRNAIVKVATGSTWVATDLAVGSGLDQPWGLAIDRNNNLYASNYNGGTISKITPAGAVSSFATGITNPAGLAFGPDGSLYVAGYNAGIIYKVPSGGGAPATFYNNNAVLNGPLGLAFDPLGKLYVASYNSSSVFAIAQDLQVTPITGVVGMQRGARNLAFRTDGVMFIGAYDTHSIFRMEQDGGVNIVAQAPRNIFAMAQDSAGNLFLGTYFLRAFGTRFVNPPVIDYNLYKVPYLGAGKYGPFKVFSTGFNSVGGLAINPVDNKIYVSDANGYISKVEPSDGSSIPWARTNVSPTQMAFDKDGNLWLSHGWRTWDSIMRITPSGTQSTFRSGRNFYGIAYGGGKYWVSGINGGTVVSISGIDGAATNVLEVDGGIGGPQVLAFDTAGNRLYIASNNNRIYSFNPADRSVTDLGDPGLSNPWGMVVAGGKLFVANHGNSTITRHALGTGAKEATFTLPGGNPTGLSWRPGNSKLYAAVKAGEIYEISSPTGSGTVNTTPWAIMRIRHPSRGRAIYLWSIAWDGTDRMWADLGGDRPRNNFFYRVNPGAAPFSGNTLDESWGTNSTYSWSWAGQSRQMVWDGTRIVGSANIIRQAQYPSTLNRGASLAIAYQVPSGGYTFFGTQLSKTVGMQPGPTVGGFQTMLTTVAFRPISFQPVQITGASPLSWRRMPDSSGVASIYTRGHPWQLDYDIAKKTFLFSQFATRGRLNQQGIGVVTDTGAYTNLNSSGWTTRALYNPNGDIIAASAWGGAGNTPLQRFAGGAGSAQVLDHWFYTPGF